MMEKLQLGPPPLPLPMLLVETQTAGTYTDEKAGASTLATGDATCFGSGSMGSPTSTLTRRYDATGPAWNRESTPSRSNAWSDYRTGTGITTVSAFVSPYSHLLPPTQ